MSPVGMTLLLLSTLAMFAWSASRRWRQLTIGAPTPGFELTPAQIVARARDVAVYALGQKKMPYYRVAGLAHMAIFGGFMVLLLNTLMLWARGYDASFDFWGLLDPHTVIGGSYSLLKELFAAGVLAGTCVFFYLRLARKGRDSVEGRARMTLGVEGLIILGIIATMMLADFLYVGASLVRESRIFGEELTFQASEPIGSVFAYALSGVESMGWLEFWQHLGFWWHASLVLIFLNILPFSKHFHIITAIPNVFARDLSPPGRLPKVDDLEGRVEREESLGIDRIQDLSWKHILDLYTCTECGRCSDNCPAYITDKKLSPKHLTLALRDHLYASEDRMFADRDGVGRPGDAPAAASGKEEIHTHPRPPADAYFRSEEPGVELVSNVVDPDVLWACTSCRACEEQCPVMISYVDKIVGMRRELVMMKNEFPPQLTGAFQGIETNGNPWRMSAMDRADWADGLDVPLLSDHPDAAVLYWVGCAASFDDRAKKVARATARLMKHAGVDFAILGTEESCTGDPARRAGNEYLFQMVAEANIETLNGYGVDKKTIVTACPHCFNTLLNEYPDFGGRYDVVHHADFLNGLIARGSLKPTRAVKARVAYHDSCYLGRYNAVYDSPREILEAIPGVTLLEVPYWNRNKGLCCGAGGAQYFMEEQNDNRVNVKRTLQLVDTGAQTIASGCPFCMTMLTDGLKAQEKEEEIDQLDVAELLERAVELGADAAG